LDEIKNEVSVGQRTRPDASLKDGRISFGNEMNFTRIGITEWQQFQNVDIEFHERVTVLTGANGCGKTTLLNLLARHGNWQAGSLATPKKYSMSGVSNYLTRLWNGKDRSNENTIGSISYSNGQIATLVVPNQSEAQYHINIAGQRSVKCFFIPSHRSVFRYQQLQNIPTQKKSKDIAFAEVSNFTQQRYFGSTGESQSFLMKAALIGWAIQGYGISNNGKDVMLRDDEQVKFYEGFQKVLKDILPKSLGFKEFEIRNMEIVFICNDGKDEFLLETASGGISALIDIAWQIYMYSTKENQTFTVIIDEVENHLHPTMQREILPDLVRAFPNVRFIVSTHSPLIVSSVRESHVYALLYGDQKKIVSKLLDFKNKAKTAGEILNEVLGVSFTMPIWAEDELTLLMSKYEHRVMDEAGFLELRSDLFGAGLEQLMPLAISNLIKGK
jgi:predicted ATPase